MSRMCAWRAREKSEKYIYLQCMHTVEQESARKYVSTSINIQELIIYV